MLGTTKPALRLRGSGEHLRLRLTSSPDLLATVHECCRASTAVEKALGESVQAAIAAGHSWAEVAQALGVQAHTAERVQEEYGATHRWMQRRFWGLDRLL